MLKNGKKKTCKSCYRVGLTEILVQWMYKGCAATDILNKLERNCKSSATKCHLILNPVDSFFIQKESNQSLIILAQF